MKTIFLIFLLISNILSKEISFIDNRDSNLKKLTSTWNTNWKKHSVDYSDILSGGPPRDGIPPLDKPKFINIKDAKSWLNDNDALIFVKINNKSKAYALKILIWHEIVNDTLDKEKIVVTFCPLCNASFVYSRIINKKEYTFGTSGLLRYSDLVMFDRESESLWQQFSGEAIIGDKTGITLNSIDSSIISFKDIYSQYPNTKILSKNTGFYRSYGNNPYIGYDDINSSPFLLKNKSDSRLLPMRRVTTLEINNKSIVYSHEIFKNKNLINDVFENNNIVVFYKKNLLSVLDKKDISESKLIASTKVYNRKIGQIILRFYYKDGFYYDKQTNSKWNFFGKALAGKYKNTQMLEFSSGNHFWFSYSIFKKNILIYKEK
ncbi:MAG: DUF3179 domain-containing protein [Campylobacteraceae bacterium]|nr:DUF3179 domain-containing protein [Campylobacteraceae bacterium]